MAFSDYIDWLKQLSQQWVQLITQWLRQKLARALELVGARPVAEMDEENLVPVTNGESAAVVEDASFCQVHNEIDENDEKPMLDLEAGVGLKKSNTSCDSDISATGKTITKSFEVDDVLTTKDKQHQQQESNDDLIADNYSSDFESDNENEKEEAHGPKTIKDIRKSVLGEYRGAFFDEYADVPTYQLPIKINLEDQVVQSVEVEGNFNDWKEPVELTPNHTDVLTNSWEIELETTKREVLFRFIIDGSRMLSSDYPVDESKQYNCVELANENFQD